MYYSPTRIVVRLIPLVLLIVLIRTIWTSQPPSRLTSTRTEQQLAQHKADLEEKEKTAAQQQAPLGEDVLAEPDPENVLLPMYFAPLPLGTIKPEGWMRDQMRAMAAGLPGHLHDFYLIVRNSTWLGGKYEYSGLNEGLPYWLNGIVPLAYSLDDDRLKEQIHVVVEHVITSQADDGWLGPEQGDDRVLWGRFPLFLALTQLMEANSTYEASVVPAMHRFTELMHNMLKDGYKGYQKQANGGPNEDTFSWGRVRYADMMIALQWLYEHHPENNGDILLESMDYLHTGALDWTNYYTLEHFIAEDVSTLPLSRVQKIKHFLHGVNIAQGLKAAAVVRRLNHDDHLLVTALDSVKWTFRFHGATHGSIIADERLAGVNPWSGSELCTAVETMYSLAYMYQALGNQFYAERLELTAFNALPAMITPDWWAHQYITQLNQPFAKYLEDTPFFNTNGWSQTFGLEPNYPCCTVNQHQGFPKYLSHSWVRMGANGVGHALLGPSSIVLELEVGRVTITCKTNYPFSNKLFYTINTPGPFDFYFRVPGWATDRSSYLKDSRTPYALRPHPHTGMHHMHISFRGVTEIVYDLHAVVNPHPRANDTIAVHHGPLLYALEIPGSADPAIPSNPDHSQQHAPGYAPEASKDWIMTNITRWNIAIDPSTVVGYSLLDNGPNVRQQKPLNDPLFATGGPPTWMTVLACEINWPLMGSVPGPPIPKSERKCIGEVFEAKLVPYGSAKLHMAELPSIDLSEGSPQLPDLPPQIPVEQPAILDEQADDVGSLSEDADEDDEDLLEDVEEQDDDLIEDAAGTVKDDKAEEGIPAHA